MIRLYLLFILLFATASTYAQRVMIPSTSVIDSVKSNRLKKNDIEDVNGIKMGTAKDIIENLREVKQFSILAKLMRSAGLIATFKSKGPITLFAPTNAAFNKLRRGRIDTLQKKSHNLELCALLTYQAIPGNLKIKDLRKKIKAENGKAKIPTLSGSILTLTTDSADNIILIDEYGNKGTIIAADLDQSNGYIHVINKVLIPKPKSI
ncbi:fasciclin domain-containing protein [Mucilaginibacter sp. KACC 22063]|uniref:fasciclin domain-containing protein n=1 Tax=Mucilaginibacter sp. KACC 22063 TaxID=3025666 RepID=UPI0023667FFE|nr:fasciclin domain-containing protein [Mucilaginibacter sp. KACC 22063]WDF53420.1 fasciclin domain-containing protein [Mucilaginibacter sp. KACC 22063]